MKKVTDFRLTTNASHDQTVLGMQAVTLNGIASSDAEGPIASYLWQQTSGPSVALTNATSAIASFTAPPVGTTSVLTFTLTVTDSNGVSSSDSVAITVNPGDTTPPVTTASYTTTKSHGVTYYNVTLTANEPSIINYSVRGPGSITNPPPPGPTAAFTVQRTGTGDITLTYGAIDLAYNRELPKSLLLK